MTRKNEWDIVVVGGAYTDYMVRGSRLPKPGETVQGNVFMELPGGKGANQAVAAARLGGRVAMVTKVGSDQRGDTIVNTFADEGVNTHYIVRDKSEPTGASLIQVEEKGQKQMLIWTGPTHRLSVQDVEVAADIIKTARVVMTQLEIALEATMAVARLASQAGVKIVLDPSPPVQLPDELVRLVDVIKPNADEAEVITGIHVQDRNSARSAAEKLLERGVKAVSIEAGHEGNLVVWQGGECWLPHIPIKSIDATGAGDAFAGALAVMLVEGHTLAEAGPFANATAALTTTKLGARPSLPRRNEVEQLLAHLKSGG